MTLQNRPDVSLSGRIFSYGSNDLNSREIFRQRSVYNRLIFSPENYPTFLNTWNEDRFYGIVDTKGNSVQVDTNQLRPLSFPTGKSQFALNFVADAWRDLAIRLRELADQNIIFKNSPWAAPSVEKAWDSVSLAYDDYMINVVYRAFNESFLDYGDRDQKITGVETFLAQFEEFAELVMVKAGPFTKSGFLEGSYVSPMVSGLMIEISDTEYDEDFSKTYIYRDANFDLIVGIAEQYGFTLDRNIPWRFIADLRNPAMREYMYGVPIVEFTPAAPLPEDCDPQFLEPDSIPRASGYSQVPGLEDVIRRINVYVEGAELLGGYKQYQELRDIVDQGKIYEVLYSTAYTETWNNDMSDLQNYLVKFYNTYAGAMPHVMSRASISLTESCVPPVIMTTRSLIEAEDFNNIYGPRWQLKNFYILRSVERRATRSRPERIANVQEILNIYNLSNTDAFDRALRYAQEKFIGPYDRDPVSISTVGQVISGSPI